MLVVLWKSYQQTLRVVEYLFLSFFWHFFVIWFCICLSFLFCAVIFLSFSVAFHCHFVVILLSFCCHLVLHFFFSFFFVIFFSCFCRFLVRRGWPDPEPTWKIQKLTFYQHLSHLFVIFCHFLAVLSSRRRCLDLEPTWKVQNVILPARESSCICFAFFSHVFCIVLHFFRIFFRMFLAFLRFGVILFAFVSHVFCISQIWCHFVCM